MRVELSTALSGHPTTLIPCCLCMRVCACSIHVYMPVGMCGLVCVCGKQLTLSVLFNCSLLHLLKQDLLLNPEFSALASLPPGSPVSACRMQVLCAENSTPSAFICVPGIQTLVTQACGVLYPLSHLPSDSL